MPDIPEHIRALHRENNRLLHAIQTGVEYTMPDRHRDTTGENPETSPKQLRVGVNNALCNIGALTRLLIDKGVFTEEEYFTASNVFLARDVESYQERIKEKFDPDGTSPTNITLG